MPFLTKDSDNPGTALTTSKDTDRIAEALSAAQGKIEAAERDSENPHFHSSYSSLAAMKAACRPHLAEQGLSVIQAVETDLQEDKGKVYITTRLMHRSGQYMEMTLGLPVLPMSRRKVKPGEEDDSDAARAPGKINAQAVGSTITYGMRYGYSAMIGIVPEADDDDGTAGSGGEARAQTTPIPADGRFEDVVADIGFREVPNKGGGEPYRFPFIITGSHGKVECADKVAEQASVLKGTAEAVRFTAEKGKYGWKVLAIQRVEVEHTRTGTETFEGIPLAVILNDDPKMAKEGWHGIDFGEDQMVETNDRTLVGKATGFIGETVLAEIEYVAGSRYPRLKGIVLKE